MYYYQLCNVREQRKDRLRWVKACMTTVDRHSRLVVVMHESVTCDTVLVTYWSQVCWERARRWGRGRGRGARRWRGVAVSVTQGAFALADECLLVPLHPLQLLIGTHLAPLLLLRRVPRVQTLQGTFWSLLRGVGGERVDNTSREENKNKSNEKVKAYQVLIKSEKGHNSVFTTQTLLRLWVEQTENQLQNYAYL